MVDRNLWKEWMVFVIKRTGSARKLSAELEKAMKEYMDKHSEKEGKEEKALR